MLDVLFDAFKDSAITFVFILIVYFVLSFLEDYVANKLSSKKKFSPLIGATLGLIPQCGISIVGADLYQKKKITMGTIIAIFIACSDEAIPILISSCKNFGDGLHILLLLLCKFIFASLVGLFVDFVLRKKKNEMMIEKHKEIKLDIHEGCCHHHIEKDDEDEKDFLHKHILHPLVHSLKIALYILIINLIFGFILYFLKEDVITTFLNQNLFLTPLFTSLVGLIPNCASSVIISKMYLMNSLTFGATMAGLICNAGLGFVFLLKDKKNIKNNLLILLIVWASSLLFGYLCLLVESCFF